ncbi:uncharacterized protein BDR25DRAFT_94734 [Lindgomyces ingoldianus]|uniref:Uncharacterized protein n=1 Tax=Lindgomyces ingoldianus TaxID=673940 RepID=A0ACB6QCE1_9PLEO|nr:uncharacterized protein BDR25DRAFT_94734 [Lindgomyces ingoldianus]KAF2464699.1 hypothetical protein BDR25DRAFT_94734 [Lindgomyces ingoldianus]
MCVAELNVSLLPCRHRWYHLTRSCSPSTNLANCGAKLGITGWEIKCDFCPYCSGWNLSTSEYRLVGNDRTPSIGGLSRTPSLAATRRDSRRGSLARSDSSTSITMMAQEKNRAMNARVDAYFRVPVQTSALPEVEDEVDGIIATSPSDTASEGQESLRQASSTSSQSDKAGLMKKMRKRSKRLSLGLFK